MGYYTAYNLEHDCTDEEVIEKIVAEFEGKEIIGYALDKSLSAYEAAKWYEHEEDMREISKMFPDVHFTLHGEGESQEDIWDEHYLGGKMQRCNAVITIPEFDERLLEYGRWR